MQTLRVNGDRLWQSLMETALIGSTPDGGIRRLTLTDEDRQIRDWFREKCRSLDCKVTVDQVGNMFAVRQGKNPDALPIAVGSHLDTQPTGGKFDGILGVLAGIEILATLKDAGHITERPIMVVNWTNEEGSRFSPAMLGSGVHAGVFDRAFADSRTDSDGTTFSQALESMGYRGVETIGSTRFAAMLELHIEQGPVLEFEDKQIGVVVGVQAARWFDVVVDGQNAHAGTTPMEMRRDALLSAAKIIAELPAIAATYAGLVTVGELAIENSSRNVVPGRVRFSVDLRHHDNEQLDAMESDFRALVSGHTSGGMNTITVVWDSAAVMFDPGCIEAVKRAALDEGLSVREIVSGAGHDSVYVSRVAPTAMIFVPCKDGLSHNPLESSTYKQCADGAQTMLNAVLKLGNSTRSD